jgi:tagaturonate reductase
MILSKQTIASVPGTTGVNLPTEELFSLPEKVLQFGTGVLLRGLPDYFIDKANKKGIFNGRVVVIKSTASGGTDAFEKQDNLYTVCIRGIDNGRKTDEVVVNASISRVLSAATEWKQVLACAGSPDMQVIISNTTEVGIALVDDDMNANPPVSFPGKLLAFLHARYKHFNGSADSGMVVIPTELLPGNGDKLKSIVIEQARRHKLDDAFIEWIGKSNDFCNSLVDRIVPGKLSAADAAAMESRVGYKDDLMIMSEVYRLWAIETSSERTKNILSFSKADEGVVIAPAIEKFRELKLRLLNGSHTFTCGLAVLAGFTTVKQAMDDEHFSVFITQLMLEEIVPAITSDVVSAADAKQFAAAVLDRYRNPFIEHHWLSICLQYTSKMKMRNVPSMMQYYSKTGNVPQHMAVGFAAWLLFMRSDKKENAFTGTANNKEYTIQDDCAAAINELWRLKDKSNFVTQVLQDKALWGADLNELPGFAEAVQNSLQALEKQGAMAVLKNFASKKIVS